MNDPTRNTPIVTPEAVALDLDLAGAGSRLIATMVDGFVLAGFGVLLLLAGVALSVLGTPVEILLIAGLILWSVITLLYYPILEGLWNGRTIGKNYAKIRVIHADGTPVTWRAVVVRNLMRLVDQIAFIGFFSIVLTRRSQRLGDLAAGTIVVHEHSVPPPSEIDLEANSTRERLAVSIDTSLLTPKEYAMVRSFLERRTSLHLPARQTLANEIATLVAAKIGFYGANMTAETFLEAVHVSVKLRSEGASTMSDSSSPLL